GEALISFLQADGTPGVVERAFVHAPASRLGAITPEERAATMAASPLKVSYDEVVDRESAFEILRQRAEGVAPAPATGSWRRPDDVRTRPAGPDRVERAEERRAPAPRTEEARAPAARREKSAMEKVILGDGRRQGLAEAMAKSVARQVGSSLGRQITRGILGSILKG